MPRNRKRAALAAAGRRPDPRRTFLELTAAFLAGDWNAAERVSKRIQTAEDAAELTHAAVGLLTAALAEHGTDPAAWIRQRGLRLAVEDRRAARGPSR
jgi:hypothetical protein